MQSELDLQRTVSQEFSQTSQQVNKAINQKIDAINSELEKGNLSDAEKTKLETQRDNWQYSKVLLNMVASGLSAPTQSGVGIAAATAAPAVSYEIGQYFKAQGQEGSLKHIVAHAILGAAVSAAGDNNVLAGALSAGGSEAAAPLISQWLYQEADGSKLTAEQKDTVNAITSALGAATGAAVGGTAADVAQGSLNAQNAVENNNGARARRNARNPLWTEAQAWQNQANADRILFLTNQIRRIEPKFTGIPSWKDPNRPFSNEDVREYEQYLNRIILRNSNQPPFVQKFSPILGRRNINTSLNEVARDINLNQLGNAFNSRPRVNGNLNASNINLQIGLRTVHPNRAASQNGMPVYSNVSDGEIFGLYQQYTGSQPIFRNIPNKGVLASTTIQSGSWRGTTVILRDFSTTQNQTRARWTIEFQNPPSSINRKRMELKFR